MTNAVYVAIRRDQPLNLVGAFETPVQTVTGGYVEPSVKALIQHAKAVYDDYLGKPERAFAIGAGMEALAEKMSLAQLLDAVEQEAKALGGQA